jgi:hypothetical protein
MDASRLIAWTIGLVWVALGIAFIVSETEFVEHLTRLEMPTVPSQLSALLGDTQLMGWELVSFAGLLMLLCSKLR